MPYITLERNKLYKEIWKEPISLVCKRYSLSDNGLRKICNKLNIPIPDNSYWGKYRAGKNPQIRELPKNNEDSKYEAYIDEWAIKRREQRKEDSLIGFNEKEKINIINICNNIKIRNSITNLHPLIEKNKENLKNKNNIYFNTKYDKKNYLNINGKAEVKNRMCIIYNTIFDTIEKLGYSVEIDTDSFYLNILGENIKFSIREMSKIIYRDTTEQELKYRIYYENIEKIRELEPTGVLELKIDYYYAKKNIWKDTDKKKIEDMISEIIMEFLYCATKMRQESIKKEEEQKLCMVRRERTCKIREQKEEEIKKLDELEQMSGKLCRANKIRIFIKEYSKRRDLSVEEIKWIEWAKDKADWIDPLVNKKDEIIDQKENI